MKEKIICYDCGRELMLRKYAKDLNPYPEIGETVEHIPAQMMFAGYAYTGKRIVVPCCYSCNQKSMK